MFHIASTQLGREPIPVQQVNFDFLSNQSTKATTANQRISTSLKPHSRASNVPNRSRQNGLVLGLTNDGWKRPDVATAIGDRNISPGHMYGSTSRSFNKQQIDLSGKHRHASSLNNRQVANITKDRLISGKPNLNLNV